MCRCISLEITRTSDPRDRGYIRGDANGQALCGFGWMSDNSALQCIGMCCNRLAPLVGNMDCIGWELR